MKFNNYPVVVDPASNVVTVRQSDVGSEGAWRHLERVRVDESAPFISTNEASHVFGNAETIARSKFLLCYDTTGFLTSVYHREANEWIRHAVPEESSGKAERYPSIRFVFENEVDRDNFSVVLQRMSEAVRALDKPSADDAFRLVQIVLRQPHPPRSVHVAIEDTKS